MDRSMVAYKAWEIVWDCDLELAADASADADVFCPRCGAARTVGGYLGDPGFRWCRICGAHWRLFDDPLPSSLNAT